jgi:hypothetical protein
MNLIRRTISLFLAAAILAGAPGPSAWAALAENSGVTPITSAVRVLALGGSAQLTLPGTEIGGLNAVPNLAPSIVLTIQSPETPVVPATPVLLPTAATPAAEAATPDKGPEITAAEPALAQIPSAEPVSSAKEQNPGGPTDGAGAAGRKLFDGDDLQARVFIVHPGQSPLALTLATLPAALAADPSLRESLARSGRIRLVVDKAGAGGLTSAHAAAIDQRLLDLGINRKLEVEPLDLKGQTRAPAETAVAAPAPQEQKRSWLKAVFLEPAFLVRQFTGSLTKPRRSEFMGGVMSSAPSFWLSLTYFTAVFLPHHPFAFTALLGLTIALKTFHGVWVNSWANFQSRLVRLRSVSYLSTFNLVYGQATAALYRAITCAAIPKTVSPLQWQYWKDQLIISMVGAFFGTLGYQAGNELYEKGVVSRKGRSFVIQGRQISIDLGGMFFKTGKMGPFWIIFAAQQTLDFIFYILTASARARPIVYIVSNAVASTEDFKGLYPMKDVASGNPLKRAAQALAEVPIFKPFIALGKFVWRTAARRRLAAAALGAGLALTPKTVATSYALALEASPASAQELRRLPLVELVLDSQGRPKPAAAEGISVPLLTREPDGSLGVFKPVRLPPDHPMYKYERLKLVREVVASYIMETMGVPTVRYRMARAVFDGVEMIGVVSPFIAMNSLEDKPALADKIVNADDFTRGSVVDAWLGNTDRILNQGNIWLREDASGTHAVFGDYDQALRLGLDVFGVTKVPLPFFHRYARPSVVKEAVAAITTLDDAQIQTLVDEALAAEAGFGVFSRDYLAGVLIYNRDLLKRGDAFDAALSGEKPSLRLSPEAAAALADAVLQGRKDPAQVGSQIDAALKDVIYLWDHPQLSAPMKDLLEKLVRRRLAGDESPLELDADSLSLLPALTNFVYAKIEPAVAMRSGLGYYP